jgi:putative transposase
MTRLRSLPGVVKSLLTQLPSHDYPVMNTQLFVKIWLTYILDKSVTSLRDLFFQLNHTGVEGSLSAFSRASSSRGLQFINRLFVDLLHQVRRRPSQKDVIICPFDSTVISLTSKFFWAEQYHQVKVLTSLNQETQAPSEVLIHFGERHDAYFGQLVLGMTPENGLAVGDRGFASKDLFNDFMNSNKLFLIRIKSNWIIDENGWVDVKGRKVRVVNFCDLEKRIEYRLATNVPIEIMDDEEIREAYRQRWQIELLWKFLKGHLKLDRLATKSVNGVTIQIYMVLIAYLILLLIEIPKVYGKELLDKLRYIQLVIRQDSNFVIWMTRMTGDPKV